MAADRALHPCRLIAGAGSGERQLAFPLPARQNRAVVVREGRSADDGPGLGLTHLAGAGPSHFPERAHVLPRRGLSAGRDQGSGPVGAGVRLDLDRQLAGVRRHPGHDPGRQPLRPQGQRGQSEVALRAAVRGARPAHLRAPRRLPGRQFSLALRRALRARLGPHVLCRCDLRRFVPRLEGAG